MAFLRRDVRGGGCKVGALGIFQIFQDFFPGSHFVSPLQLARSEIVMKSHFLRLHVLCGASRCCILAGYVVY